MQTEPIAARAVFDHLIQQHYISQYVSMQHWLPRLQARANTENDYIFSVVAQSIHDVEAVLTNRHTYDCSCFEHAIRKCGMNRPHIDITYLMPLLQRYKAAAISTAYRN